MVDDLEDVLAMVMVSAEGTGTRKCKRADIQI